MTLLTVLECMPATVFQVSVVKAIAVVLLSGMVWPAALRTRAVGIVATLAGNTEPAPRSALPTDPSRMFCPVIVPGAMLPPVSERSATLLPFTDPSASFALVTAPSLIFPVFTAPFTMLLAVTTFLPRLTA